MPVLSQLKRRLLALARAFVLGLPLPATVRLRIVELAYASLGALFAGVPHYETWRRSRQWRQTALVSARLAADLAVVDPGRLRFPACSDPRVSVCIVRRGAAAEMQALWKSLAAVHRAAPPWPIEVLALGEFTPVEAAAVGALGVVPIRMPAGFGRVAAWRSVATQARAPSVFLVDAGTIIADGVLEYAVESLDRRDRCGLVGGRLIDPDGRLIEAGGILWRDGGIDRVGTGVAADRSEFNYQREVDFCSEDAVLVRTELLRAAFNLSDADPTESRAVAELALRIGDLGRSACFDPRVLAIVANAHKPPATARGDLRETGQPPQRDERLARQAERGTQFSAAKDSSLHCRTVLIVDQYVPRPDRDAGSRAMDNLIELFLAAGWQVKIWPHNLWFEPFYTERLQAMGVEVFYGDQWVGRLDEWLATASHRLDAVLLSRPMIAADCIDSVKRCTSARIIYYGHDIHYLRQSAQRAVDPAGAPPGFEIARMRRLERMLWQRADSVVYLSDSEVEEVRRHAASACVVQFPLFGYSSFRDPTPLRRRPGKDVLFVSGFGHPPNVDAAVWFTRDVWPLVLARVPEARLRLVGANPTAAVQALRGASVEVTGSVSEEELVRHYDEARVCVVPLRFGAGVKGKTVEALRWGVPVVGTTVGAEGMPGVGQAMRVCDEPEALAMAVVELLKDDALWQAYSAMAQEFAKTHFSMAALRTATEEALGFPLVDRTPAVGLQGTLK